MYPYLRLLKTLARARFRPNSPVNDESGLTMRVLPGDSDFYPELNNGRHQRPLSASPEGLSAIPAEYPDRRHGRSDGDRASGAGLSGPDPGPGCGEGAHA